MISKKLKLTLIITIYTFFIGFLQAEYAVTIDASDSKTYPISYQIKGKPGIHYVQGRIVAHISDKQELRISSKDFCIKVTESCYVRPYRDQHNTIIFEIKKDTHN